MLRNCFINKDCYFILFGKLLGMKEDCKWFGWWVIVGEGRMKRLKERTQ